MKTLRNHSWCKCKVSTDCQQFITYLHMGILQGGIHLLTENYFLFRFSSYIYLHVLSMGKSFLEPPDFPQSHEWFSFSSGVSFVSDFDMSVTIKIGFCLVFMVFVLMLMQPFLQSVLTSNSSLQFRSQRPAFVKSKGKRKINFCCLWFPLPFWGLVKYWIFAARRTFLQLSSLQPTLGWWSRKLLKPPIWKSWSRNSQRRGKGRTRSKFPFWHAK